jgi:hypothetical protein
MSMRVSGSKNVTMGFCANLSFDRLELFVASPRNTTFTSIRRLRQHGIIVERAIPSAQPRMALMSGNGLELNRLVSSDAG